VETNRTCRGIGLLLREMSVHEAKDKSDGQLLEHFLVQRDEAAFTALVRRHGPMVLSVCRRVLGNATDAEDTFQATFLILVRKASSLRSHPVLAGWLHEVARRTALKAKVTAARRRVKEQAVARSEAQEEPVQSDLLAQLDRELARLPEKYRLPLVLCDLEGKTRRETAEQLGWPEGTVAGRLARSRALLAKRLLRSNPSLFGGMPLSVASGTTPAALPPGLVGSTVRAATLVASSGSPCSGALSAGTGALVQAVIRAMFWSQMQVSTAALLRQAVGR
jgi:RNA polymerase sigma factor (sigma-70 family)